MLHLRNTHKGLLKEHHENNSLLNQQLHEKNKDYRISCNILEEKIQRIKGKLVVTLLESNSYRFIIFWITIYQ